MIKKSKGFAILFLSFIALYFPTFAENISQDSLNCFRYKGSISSGSLDGEEVFTLKVTNPNIYVYQSGKQLSINKLETVEDQLLNYTVDIPGDQNILKDNDFFTTLKIDPKVKNDILISFNKLIDGKDFYFILGQSSNYYTPVFSVSIDGKEFQDIDHYYIKKHPLKYVKIRFEPKKEKKENENEIISIGEINFKEKLYSYAVKSMGTGTIDVFAQYDCGNAVPQVQTDDTLKPTKSSKNFNVELELFGGDSINPKDISSPYIKIRNTLDHSSQRLFPRLEKIIQTVFIGLIILSIALYIRFKAKSKDIGILPQKMIRVKRKKVVKKMKNFIVNNHKKISIIGISSINLLIKGKRKSHEIKSKKLIKILKLVLSHYEENKNTFFPGELKQIYVNVVNDFKDDLSKKAHKKAIAIIDEFIEKGGKLVINMKDKK